MYTKDSPQLVSNVYMKDFPSLPPDNETDVSFLSLFIVCFILFHIVFFNPIKLCNKFYNSPPDECLSRSNFILFYVTQHRAFMEINYFIFYCLVYTISNTYDKFENSVISRSRTVNPLSGSFFFRILPQLSYVCVLIFIVLNIL